MSMAEMEGLDVMAEMQLPEMELMELMKLPEMIKIISAYMKVTESRIQVAHCTAAFSRN